MSADVPDDSPDEPWELQTTPMNGPSCARAVLRMMSSEPEEDSEQCTGYNI